MSLLHIAGGATEDKLYVEDVFSAYLYTGNGSTQTINNGIDLASKGGLVWIKDRGAASQHGITDTARGRAKSLYTNLTNAEYTTGAAQDITAFNSNGFSLGTTSSFSANNNAASYVSWTFRKAPKFFDIVTYTGNGVAGRQIPHSLGCEVGMIVLKCTSNSTDWVVYHRFLGATKRMFLNTTDSQITNSLTWNNTEPTSNNFTLGTSGAVNGDGLTYVAYLFAHDPSADGIIQCGSFTTDASGNATVNLGWEPQFTITRMSAVADNWQMLDAMRGMIVSGGSPRLLANTSAIEGTGLTIVPTATGFNASGWTASSTYIYLAIRRPMKVPTSGTEVYNGTYGLNVTTTGQKAFNSSFVADALLYLLPASGGQFFYDRLRGGDNILQTSSTSAETAGGFVMFDTQNGVNSDTVFNFSSRVGGLFKRAKGFMDIVCYTGTGVARTVNHNLGVVPELMIVKIRTGSTANWAVYHRDTGATQLLQLSTNGSAGVNPSFNDTEPTSSAFSIGTSSNVNEAAFGYVAYLFASCPGVSKIFSYVGNGTTQNIECGFTTGARFIMVKASSTTGDWLIADTVRGVTAGSDPRLSLNTTAAEVTTEDWVDNYAGGFTVNQVAGSNANVNGVTYIGMAIA